MISLCEKEVETSCRIDAVVLIVGIGRCWKEGGSREQRGYSDAPRAKEVN